MQTTSVGKASRRWTHGAVPFVPPPSVPPSNDYSRRHRHRFCQPVPRYDSCCLTLPRWTRPFPPLMKKWTNRPSLRQRSQTLTRWNSSGTCTGMRFAQYLSQDLLHTSSGRSRRRSGWRRTMGWRPHPQEEVHDAEKPEAGRRGCG